MWWFVPLAGLLLVVSTADGPQAEAQARASCRTAGSTIDAGPGGRVYKRRTRDPGRVYLCSYRTERSTAIGWDDCFNALGVVEVRFTRRFVALGLWSCAPGGTSATVDLRSTASGRRVRRILRPGGDDPGELEYVTDLVVRRDGALAWIIELRDTVAHRARSPRDGLAAPARRQLPLYGPGRPAPLGQPDDVPERRVVPRRRNKLDARRPSGPRDRLSAGR